MKELAKKDYCRGLFLISKKLRSKVLYQNWFLIFFKSKWIYTQFDN